MADLLECSVFAMHWYLGPEQEVRPAQRQSNSPEQKAATAVSLMLIAIFMIACRLDDTLGNHNVELYLLFRGSVRQRLCVLTVHWSAVQVLVGLLLLWLMLQLLLLLLEALRLMLP